MGTPWDPDRKGNYRIGLPMKLIELAKQASEISGLYVEWQDLAEDAVRSAYLRREEGGRFPEDAAEGYARLVGDDPPVDAKVKIPPIVRREYSGKPGFDDFVRMAIYDRARCGRWRSPGGTTSRPSS